MSLHLIGTNGFYIKAENERFSAVVSRCRQNFKFENITSFYIINSDLRAFLLVLSCDLSKDSRIDDDSTRFKFDSCVSEPIIITISRHIYFCHERTTMTSETSENTIFIRFYFTLCYLMLTLQARYVMLSHPHVIKCNSSVFCEAFTKHWNLRISLTEVIQHYKLCFHLYTTLNGFCCCTKKIPKFTSMSKSLR